MRVIAWVLAVIVVIVLILVIWNWMYFVPSSGFGTLSEPKIGPCMVPSELCTEEGERTIVQVCTPNKETGKGCLDKDGNQIYDLLIVKESCNISCRESVWQDVTDPDQPCVVKDDGENIPSDICVLPDSRGTTTKKLKCVAHDSTGSNACTSLEIRNIMGPTGVNGNYQQLEVYNVGDTVEFEELCGNFSNPLCGDWQLVQPFDRDPTKPIGDNPEDTVSSCEFNEFLTPITSCVINKDDTWNDLKEGYIGQTMGCIIPEETGNFAIIPDFNDPVLKKCEVLDRPTCSKMIVTPNQIIDGSLPTNFMPLKCGKVLQSNNPQCVRGCRLDTITKSIGIKDFDPILTKVMILEKENFFLSAYQVPRNDGKLIKFSDQVASPQSNLDDVPLYFVGKNEITRKKCTPQQIQYDSSVMFLLAPREVSGNNLICQIMVMIDGSYLGWLTVGKIKQNLSPDLQSNPDSSGDVGLWRQAYSTYNGFGISTKSAQKFIVSVDQPFLPNGTGSGFVDLEGTIGITIKTASSQSITVLNSVGNSMTLNNVKALVFPQDTQLGTRVNRCKGNCNILHDPNGVPGYPNCDMDLLRVLGSD